ncbi:MAG: hypothetical protein KBC84_08265, partial [Proteobacteria bacterium]|nr:hypothetical protein [Pseudomonadota bacterium]
INFNKAAGHIESKKSFLSVKHFFELIGGQLGLIGPVIFPLFIYCLYIGYKEWKQNDQISGLYIFAAIPLAFLCLILSFTRSVYANWPMPLYYSTLLLYAHLSHRQKQIKFSPSLISKGIKFNFFLLFIGHLIFTGNDFNIPIQYLPSKKLIVGESLGREVAKKMQENPFTMCNNNSKKPFILSEKYMNASLIAFYSNYPDLVFLADPSMPKLSQFDIWQNWKKQKGDNALLVFSSEEELQDFSPLFKSIQPLGKINTLYHDEVAGEFYFYLACDYSGKNLSNLQ